MDAKELCDWFAGPSPISEMDAEDKHTIIRALRLLAAIEDASGPTPETDDHATPHNEDGTDWIRADFARRLERERNGLAAEVLRMVRLLNDNPDAHCSDIVACLNDEAKADKAKP